MNNLFKGMLDQGVVVFLDDVLIYSTTLEGDFKLLEKVLYACEDKNFTASWRSAVSYNEPPPS